MTRLHRSQHRQGSETYSLLFEHGRRSTSSRAQPPVMTVTPTEVIDRIVWYLASIRTHYQLLHFRLINRMWKALDFSADGFQVPTSRPSNVSSSTTCIRLKELGMDLVSVICPEALMYEHISLIFIQSSSPERYLRIVGIGNSRGLRSFRTYGVSPKRPKPFVSSTI